MLPPAHIIFHGDVSSGLSKALGTTSKYRHPKPIWNILENVYEFSLLSVVLINEINSM